MKVLKYSDIRQYRRSVREIRPDILRSAQEILAGVRKSGDKALKDYTRRFDGVKRRDFQLEVSREEVDQARRAAESEFRDVFRTFLDAAENIREFHQKQKENTWSYEKDGNTYGQLITPVERAGVYIPGGRAFYPSSVLMNVIPAQIAGVPDICLATPPGPDGSVHPLLIALADRLGVRRMFKLGGAQAVAAFAYGTETVPSVSKITGPGNAYVIAAKKLVMGDVGVDSLAGPSEVMILADKSADPDWIVMDLFAQAEHDPDTTVILVSDSRELIKSVIQKLLSDAGSGLSRRSIILKSLRENALAFHVENIRQGFDVLNLIAPEHAQIMLDTGLKEILGHVKNCGALFIGAHTPVAAGDYFAGPNHVIPTNGTAVFSSPLGVYDFVKRTSFVSLDPRYMSEHAEEIARMADFEKLDAHAQSARLRANGARRP